MEEQDNVDPDYLKGFNEGYTVGLYAPDLAEKLSRTEIQTPRNDGFKAGHKQLLAEKEINKNVLPRWLRDWPERNRPTPDKTQDKGREPDMDDR